MRKADEEANEESMISSGLETGLMLELKSRCVVCLL